MKVTRVVQIPLTYPLHYKRLLTFTMFPAWNMLHLIQFSSTPCSIPQNIHLDQCADACLLALQTTTLQTTPQYAQTAQMMKMRKISRWYLWMMNTGLLKKHLTELYLTTNMDHQHGLCQYPCPYAEL